MKTLNSRASFIPSVELSVETKADTSVETSVDPD